MTRKFAAQLALVCTALCAANANAVPLFFDYTFINGTTVYGSLEGVVDNDGDTVLVSEAYELEYLGETFDISDYYVGYWSEIQSLPPLPLAAGGEGVLSFSGDLMDFFACDPVICGFGVVFSAPPFVADAVVSTPNSLLTTDFNFNPNSWNLSLTDPNSAPAIPEPGTLALLAMGLVAVRLSRRRWS